MPSILNASSTIMCSHAGTAQTIPSSVRVLVAGAPVLLQTDVTTVAGCPLNVSGAPAPCVTIQWITGSLRVKVEGRPPLLQSSSGLSQHGLGTAMIAVAQPRVQAL